MKNKKIVIMAIVLIGGFLTWRFTMTPHKTPVDISIAEASATIYKSPSCGCCDIYVAYLKRNGFEVEVKNMTDISQIKDEYNIPPHLQSCHTSVFGDKFIEGHMPLEVMSEFMTGDSEFIGIALPGMPSGSPGMPGMRSGEFQIYGIDAKGDHHMFMRF